MILDSAPQAELSRQEKKKLTDGLPKGMVKVLGGKSQVLALIARDISKKTLRNLGTRALENQHLALLVSELLRKTTPVQEEKKGGSHKNAPVLKTWQLGGEVNGEGHLTLSVRDEIRKNRGKSKRTLTIAHSNNGDSAIFIDEGITGNVSNPEGSHSAEYYRKKL